MTGPKPGPRRSGPAAEPVRPERDEPAAERADRRRPPFFDRSAEPGTVPRRRGAALASAQVEVQRLSSALGALGGRGEQDLDLDAERFLRQVPVALGALDRLLVALDDPSGPEIPTPVRRRKMSERVVRSPAGVWSSHASGAGAGGSAPLDPAATLVSSMAGAPVGTEVGDGGPHSPSPASVQTHQAGLGEAMPGAARPGDDR